MPREKCGAKNLCLELRQRARMKETLVIFTVKAVFALTLDADEAAKHSLYDDLQNEDDCC